MPEYIVTVPMTCDAKMFIEAKNKEEAVDLVLEGQGEEIEVTNYDSDYDVSTFTVGEVQHEQQ